MRAATLKAALDRHELPSTCLDLEVTEGSLIADTQGAARILRELRGLGMGLDLDDFGTGYSSLSYLQSFSFESLKIDQSFGAGRLADDAGGVQQGVVRRRAGTDIDWKERVPRL